MPNFDISDAMVMGISDRAYTGEDLLFEYSVMLGETGNVMSYESFQVEYLLDGVPVDAVCEPGTYTAVISPNDENYTGTLQVTFEVVESKKDLNDASLWLERTELEYQEDTVQKPELYASYYDAEIDTIVSIEPDNYTVH